MVGKTIVMTGATSGIGQVAAESLAAQGARIVFVARDRARAETTLAALKKAGPQTEHHAHYADLSSVADMKRVASEIANAEPRIDVLINNAGALFSSRQVTKDGLEMTFATNHVAYFVLTYGLRERLAAAGGARIVNTSSSSHRSAPADMEDWQSEKKYSAIGAYSRSKLYNILFARELARKLGNNGVTANCFHPGFVATRFGSGSGPLSLVLRIAHLFALSPEQGADTLVYLATSPEVGSASGQYFYKRSVTATTPAAQDTGLAGRLWAETERLTGIVW